MPMLSTNSSLAHLKHNVLDQPSKISPSNLPPSTVATSPRKYLDAPPHRTTQGEDSSMAEANEKSHSLRASSAEWNCFLCRTKPHQNVVTSTSKDALAEICLDVDEVVRALVAAGAGKTLSLSDCATADNTSVSSDHYDHNPRLEKSVFQMLFTVTKETKNTNEQLALTRLHEATSFPGWIHDIGWGTRMPMNEWYGVICDSRGVMSISLTRNNLHGSLPSEIQYLRCLRVLDLSNNGLVGPIPVEIQFLVNLQTLNLRGNMLSGIIPAEIQHLSNLNTLILRGNMLEGCIPREIKNLAYLQRLDLAGNTIEGTIPTELQFLCSLSVLNLSYNNLTGPVPTFLASLLKLTHLFLTGNELSSNREAEAMLRDNLSNCYIEF